MHGVWARLKEYADSFFEAMAYADPMGLCFWPAESTHPESTAARSSGPGDLRTEDTTPGRSSAAA